MWPVSCVYFPITPQAATLKSTICALLVDDLWRQYDRGTKLMWQTDVKVIFYRKEQVGYVVASHWVSLECCAADVHGSKN